MTTADLFTRMAPFGFDDGATFSPCRQYRYHLWRSWGDRENRCVFVGLNPSTADETKPDPTITRCIGFAKRWGHGAIDVVNLFAWKSTDPKALRFTPDPVGPENDETIRRVMASAGRTILAWGSHAPVRNLIRDRVNQAHWIRSGRTLFTLGLCADGSPRHPLKLANRHIRESRRPR